MSTASPISGAERTHSTTLARLNMLGCGVRSLCTAVLGAAILSISTFAQDATPKPRTVPPPPVTKQIEVQRPQPAKSSTVNTNLLDAAETPNRKKEPTVVYGGLFADVARSTNRWKMFSLRKPVDPAHDGDNLMDGHSGVGPSLKLFSIGFKK